MMVVKWFSMALTLYNQASKTTREKNCPELFWGRLFNDQISDQRREERRREEEKKRRESNRERVLFTLVLERK